MKSPSSEPRGTRSLLRLLVVAGVAAAMAACSGGGAREHENAESSSEAITVCGQNTVHGMDVSHYDGTIDWTTAKANGIDFAIVKATESTTYVDPTFATNWAGMKAAGVVRGAYHFFRANADPVAQANHVVATVGTLEADDLPLVIDLETADGETGATIGASAVKFLDAVTAATGKTAMIYTSPGFITGTVGTPPAGIGKYTLWVANWGVSCPGVPSPWSGWKFWQHADNGTVPGVPASAVDLDTFNGTLAELKAFGGPPSGMDAGAPHDAGGPAHDAGGAASDAATASDGATAHEDAGGLAAGDGGVGGAGGANADAAGGGSYVWSGADSGGCAFARTSSGARGAAGVALLFAITATLRRRRRFSGSRTGT